MVGFETIFFVFLGLEDAVAVDAEVACPSDSSSWNDYVLGGLLEEFSSSFESVLGMLAFSKSTLLSICSSCLSLVLESFLHVVRRPLISQNDSNAEMISINIPTISLTTSALAVF